MSENMIQDTNWKRNLLLSGAIIGGLMGAATAYLMIRTSEEENSGPPQVNTHDILKIGVSVIGVIRGIAALGSGQ